jgi:hypothetical protein
MKNRSNDKSNRRDLALEHAVAGKVIYLLALIAVVQFGYPVTAYGTAALVLYQILYASMIVVGVIIGRDSTRHMLFLTITGSVYLVAGLFYAFNPSATWAVFITYFALIPYLGMLVWILGRFLAISKTITRDVLYAAVALYLLLGALFVPLYGLLETLGSGSFRDGSFPSASVQWQQLIYFSYTTLTSSGYGDILPISWWARSLANLEMIVGMLFITIVMARLVSIYTATVEDKE